MSKGAGDRTAVLIIGAGPAGLVLGNLLRASGIECVILERSSREHVEQRARAGFLVPDCVRVLTENGLAAGLLRNGQQHDTCALRTEQGQFELVYSGLGPGRPHTVYPQQELVRDLIAEFLARGGDIRFECTVTGVHGAETDEPSVHGRDADGAGFRLSADFVAGCDGQHGVSREATRPDRVFSREHGVSWLAILVGAPQSMAAVTYAVHPDGFAGHMARSPQVTRYYLQCPTADDPQRWSDELVWAELDRRMRVERYGALRRGPVLERRVVDMRSDVLEPIQRGRVFLVGDAASLISPSAAKGANLAVVEADMLAKALRAKVISDDEGPLAAYSRECLRRIWRAQEFSHWMINLLHGPPGDSGEARFLRALQQARLDNLRDSRAHQDLFAENYVGI